MLTVKRLLKLFVHYSSKEKVKGDNNRGEQKKSHDNVMYLIKLTEITTRKYRINRHFRTQIVRQVFTGVQTFHIACFQKLERRGDYIN